MSASTSGKQQSTGLPPPRTGSGPNMPSCFSPGLARRVRLSPMSHATAWPHSSTGLTGNRALAVAVISLKDFADPLAAFDGGTRPLREPVPSGSVVAKGSFACV